jgi:prepilin-type N-terminal cleavage/methylation domain-containing protein
MRRYPECAVERRIHKLEKNRLIGQIRSSCGFSLLEILLVMVIVGIIGVNIMIFQTSSWKTTSTSNRMLVAGQMIEKQVEKLRMYIDVDPKNRFPPKDSSYTENGITLSWKFTDASRPIGPLPRGPMANVRKCDLTAIWGKNRGDTLLVTTYLAKYF